MDWSAIGIGISAGALCFGILVTLMVKLSDHLEALNDDTSGFAQGDYPNVPHVHIWDNHR